MNREQFFQELRTALHRDALRGGMGHLRKTKLVPLRLVLEDKTAEGR